MNKFFALSLLLLATLCVNQTVQAWVLGPQSPAAGGAQQFARGDFSNIAYYSRYPEKSESTPRWQAKERRYRPYQYKLGGCTACEPVYADQLRRGIPNRQE
jgi:hypothetical protein